MRLKLEAADVRESVDRLSKMLALMFAAFVGLALVMIGVAANAH